MAQYTTTLRDLIGSIRQVKPNVQPPRCRDLVNQRLRGVLERRPFWSGTLATGILSIPAPYTTGTITLTAGSRVVAGTNTAWPVDDLVDTTITAGIVEAGSQVVTPQSMEGITEDVCLVVDSGADEEIVPVVEVGARQFRATFAKTHSAGVAIKASSLADRQIRLSGSLPTFTIVAVRSATEVLLDLPWGGATVTTSYSLVKRYYTLAHDLKDVLWVFDPVQGVPLAVHYPQAQLNTEDPRRDETGDPRLISDFRPSACGNMQYEVYPLPSTARQLPFMYVRQWPELRKDSDRLPPFLNPNLILYGAQSQALRTRVEKDDPFYDPAAANYYEQLFLQELESAIVADEGKAQQQLTQELSRWGVPGGANWAQSHDVSIYD